MNDVSWMGLAGGDTAGSPPHGAVAGGKLATEVEETVVGARGIAICRFGLNTASVVSSTTM